MRYSAVDRPAGLQEHGKRPMKIENRVEALETELKILKNEIQTTLLEIREQVLNHYYPELRAEEPTRAMPPLPRAAQSYAGMQRTPTPSPTAMPAGKGRDAGSMVVESSAAATVPPFTDIFLQDLVDEEVEEPAVDLRGGRTGYVLGHVSLGGAPSGAVVDEAMDAAADEEVDEADGPAIAPRMSPPVQAGPEKALPSGTHPVAPPKSNRRAFGALAGWVGNSVAKVGKERTLQVVETYAISNGGMAQEVKHTIVQLTTLAQDEGPHEPVGNQEMLGLLVQLDEILGEQ
jgi:hypothetical protein